MAVPHAKSGEVINVLPLRTQLASTRTTTLVKTKSLEVIRLMVPAGKDIPSHRVEGDLTVQCLEGQVGILVDGRTQVLSSGDLMYLSGKEPHAVHGIEDASLLVTILLG